MKNIGQLLSGEFDEELRVAVAEAIGWKRDEFGFFYIKEKDKKLALEALDLPPYPTSRGACEELLADLTEEEEERKFGGWIVSIILGPYPKWVSWRDLHKREVFALIRATARQICVAYLIVKGAIK